jgi:hypothetical protein
LLQEVLLFKKEQIIKSFSSLGSQSEIDALVNYKICNKIIDNNLFVFAVLQESQIIGTGSLSINKDHLSGHIFGDYILIPNKGLGSKLLEKRIIIAQAENFKFLTATTFLGEKSENYLLKNSFQRVKPSRKSLTLKSADVQDWIRYL